MQHRIFVVSTRSDVSVEDAQRHWRERHPDVFTAVRGLAGYVQNRPLEEEWERLGRRTVCSETWFPDRDSERAAYATDYYRDVVAPDESVFLERGSAWAGRVVEGPGWRPGGRYRVLAFGAASLPHDGEIAVRTVDRALPDAGLPQVLDVWVDDRSHALALARAADGFAFAAEPRAFP